MLSSRKRKEQRPGHPPIAFEDAVLNAAKKTGIDPNILVGMAEQESTLGKNMNETKAAKGLFGIEERDRKLMNKMFDNGVESSDLTSLSSGSVEKVTLSVAQFLQHYSTLNSGYGDPRGIDVALSVWRVGIGRTRANIRRGNFWDYKDPRLNETVAHYVDAVEKYE